MRRPWWFYGVLVVAVIVVAIAAITTPGMTEGKWLAWIAILAVVLVLDVPARKQSARRARKP